MINERVRIMSAQLRRGKDDRVEWDVVFGHEFVMDNLFAILPPAFPFFRVACRDAQVTNGGVEPNVKDL